MTSPTPPANTGQLATLLDELRRFVAEREWAQFHDPKNLSMAVASEAGELVALLRWVRNDDADAFVRQPENHARLRAEVADVAISLLLLCDRAAIDLQKAILDKLEVNRRNYPAESTRGRAERPERHRP
ncbi:nucleotide pyrophosphohydrolase [Hyalangium versicolor]|uniref:nucleotide pyrophosphohydrolase n=1 Tax=Hyalangium versicolor TaxID=2861190 RepID=UPI001CCD8C13|nr:nucleotide pyrophosphohydrolase [Hyalangium versicolor]